MTCVTGSPCSASDVTLARSITCRCERPASRSARRWPRCQRFIACQRSTPGLATGEANCGGRRFGIRLLSRVGSTLIISAHTTRASRKKDKKSLRDKITVLIIRPSRTHGIGLAAADVRTAPLAQLDSLSAGVWMPRIGFAYNQKPESPTTQRHDDAVVRGDDEPPSSRRDALASRNSDAPASTEIAHSVTVGGSFATPAHSAGSNGTRSHTSASNGHPANGAASNGHRSSTTATNGAQSNSPAAADDELAEWDSADTIDAVANALSALGDVIRLQAY